MRFKDKLRPKGQSSSLEVEANLGFQGMSTLKAPILTNEPSMFS